MKGKNNNVFLRLTAPILEIRMMYRNFAGLGLAVLALTSLPLVSAAAAIGMTPAQWEADGQVSFAKKDGFPNGVMSVNGAGATAKDVQFSNGTIEYDINEDGDEQETSGIWFRRQDKDTSDYLYLRPFDGCADSGECVQYAPVVRGKVQWDVYPEYQASAPIHLSGWNHVKIVVSGKQMQVFLNRETTPSLKVGNLEGNAPSGGVQLRGNASYANVVITPNAVEGLDPAPAVDPTAADARYVRHWQLSPVSSIAVGKEVQWGDMPPSAGWERIDAERKGFVNISRQHGTPGGEPDLIWLKTTISSERAQEKHVKLGFARQVWIFANGKPVYVDKNFYYPASARKNPLGRMAIENGMFQLPLQRGDNDIVIAISNDLHSRGHYGWGFEMRLDDVDGLKLQAAKPAM